MGTSGWGGCRGGRVVGCCGEGAAAEEVVDVVVAAIRVKIGDASFTKRDDGVGVGCVADAVQVGAVVVVVLTVTIPR